MKTIGLLLLLLCGSSIRTYAVQVSYCPTVGKEGQSAEVQTLSARIEQVHSAFAPSDALLIDAFYAPCGYALAWTSTGEVSPVALTAIEILRNVSAWGLNPADYPLPAVPSTRSVQSSSLAEFARWEVDLTIATMRLAKDLRCGRVAPHEINADIPVPCQGFQPAEFLWRAIQDNNLPKAFDSLEPVAPGYQRTERALRHFIDLLQEPQIALPAFSMPLKPGDKSDGLASLRTLLTRTGDLQPGGTTIDDSQYDETLARAMQSFQARHGLAPDGTLTAETYRQLTTPIANRITQLSLTLERWRWIQQAFLQPPVVVNIPEFRLRAYDSGLHVTLAMKVIVGRAYRRQTPVFQNQISSVVFRPYWNVPPSIQRKEIAPALRRDPNYLKKHDYEVVSLPGGGFRIRQRPGDRNSLGLVKLSLPNVHDVYLHGTPEQSLFARTRRDFSHGCIRVEDPVALATWVMKDNEGWTRDKIDAAMHGGQTFSVTLTHPIPVLIVYGTGFAAEDGLVYFLPDIYAEDGVLLEALKRTSNRRKEDDQIDAVALR
ncbi:MAG: L,D-transpeptidase family protein [Acidobacteriaceae bacterium]